MPPPAAHFFGSIWQRKRADASPPLHALPLRRPARVHLPNPPIKKGAGASPLFPIDGPNRLPSRGSAPATPGSQFRILKQKASKPDASGSFENERPGRQLKARDLWWRTRQMSAHGRSVIYKFPHTERATSTFFGRDDRMAEPFKDTDRGHAPMEERSAAARDWLRRWTSASCSASTMTRASCSVPE